MPASEEAQELVASARFEAADSGEPAFPVKHRDALLDYIASLESRPEGLRDALEEWKKAKSKAPAYSYAHKAGDRMAEILRSLLTDTGEDE